jgi:hypothetical protein
MPMRWKGWLMIRILLKDIFTRDERMTGGVGEAGGGRAAGCLSRGVWY